MTATSPPPEALIGNRYGRLVVVSTAPRRTRSNRVALLCRCDCGETKVVQRYHLLTGQSKSCGCYRGPYPTQVEATTKHGLWKHPLYGIWRAMVHRCTDPAAISYERYGARGIKVCERWMDVATFIADVGERPPNPPGWTGKRPYWSLDRIDNDGDYEPGNIRWATASQQMLNSRRRRSK